METVRSVTSYIVGPGFIPQILLVLLIFMVLNAIIMLFETVVNSFKRYNKQTAVILNDTYTKGTVVYQDPNDSESTLLYPSENERNGMEFSYSFHLFIDPESFTNSAAAAQSCPTSVGSVASPDTTQPSLKHILHKGNKNAFPNMAPGVFLHSDKNTIRVYMNSQSAWDNHVDIPNIPVGKWFHLVITQKGQYMDVYINGNVIQRHQFSSVPKINYGPVYVMQDLYVPQSGNPPPTMRGFRVSGAMKGMISRLKYYAFALNFSQIDALYREEPSKKIVSNSFDGWKPPYFRDDWWVTRY